MELSRLATLQPKIPVEEVRVGDVPDYGGPARFEGYALEAVLRRIPQMEALKKADAQIMFRCADGYAATMPLSLALARKGFVVFRDLDAPSGKKWKSFAHGKKEITPEPFYVVWKDVPADDLRFKWPYNLVEIELIDLQKEYSAAVPKDAEKLPAFHSFRTHCMSCHSVNLIGGAVGPELNAPKNILEYWSEENVRAFVKNPRSFRARSAMPANSHLSDAELDRVVEYLRYMQDHKLCDAKKPCPS